MQTLWRGDRVVVVMESVLNQVDVGESATSVPMVDYLAFDEMDQFPVNGPGGGSGGTSGEGSGGDSGEEQHVGEGDLRIAPGVIVRDEHMSFVFVSSQGPGGQNVNKRATKCVLRVNLDELPMTAEQLARLCKLAPSKITAEGQVVIAADEHRSQERNKSECLDRLKDLIARALVAPKVRRPTKPSRGAKERRLEGKRVRSAVKKRRRSDDD